MLVISHQWSANFSWFLSESLCFPLPCNSEAIVCTFVALSLTVEIVMYFLFPLSKAASVCIYGVTNSDQFTRVPPLLLLQLPSFSFLFLFSTFSKMDTWIYVFPVVFASGGLQWEGPGEELSFLWSSQIKVVQIQGLKEIYGFVFFRKAISAILCNHINKKLTFVNHNCHDFKEVVICYSTMKRDNIHKIMKMYI